MSTQKVKIVQFLYSKSKWYNVYVISQNHAMSVQLVSLLAGILSRVNHKELHHG